MGCLQNKLMDLVLFIKMLLFGSVAMFHEAVDTIKPLKDTVNREGEYAVVTGGNRGIGWHTVKGLVHAGMKVIVGCRDGPSKKILLDHIEAAGLPSNSIEWINLDMSSMDSVTSFAKTILNKNVPISLLINNAGIMFTPYKVTEDGFESQFAVNYLGHFLLSHLLMPQLKAAGTENQAARIINLSSSAHAFGWLCFEDLQGKSYYNEIGAYSQSKTAQIMFTTTLDENLVVENAPVKCYAMHPGLIKSDLYIQTWYARLIGNGFLFKSESQGAERVLFAALSTEVENLNGNYFANCRVTQSIPLTRNRDNQQKLWKMSCEMANITNFGAK